jgi:uncharacterized protein with HEPN domain
MPRDYKVYLEDILESVANIREYVGGFVFETFAKDKKTLHAVIRNLEVIGEAAKKIPSEIRAKSQDIDWKRISGLRDILVHEYFGVDLEILWDIVQNEIPVLESKVRTLLRSE